MHVFTYASMTEPLNKAQQKRLGGDLAWGITPSDPMALLSGVMMALVAIVLWCATDGRLTRPWKCQRRA